MLYGTSGMASLNKSKFSLWSPEGVDSGGPDQKGEDVNCTSQPKKLDLLEMQIFEYFLFIGVKVKVYLNCDARIGIYKFMK